MPFRQLPNTDENRAKALKNAKEKADNTDPANWAIDAATKARIDAFLPDWEQELTERGEALSGQTSASATEDEAMGETQMYMSHFWQVFNFAIEREVFSASDRAYYQAPVNNSEIPWTFTESEILVWGQRLIDGEAARIAAGGTAMENPTIDDVIVKYNAFVAAHNAQSTAKDEYDKEQEDVEDKRPEADDLILDIWDEVEFTYRKDDPPSKRRKAREWGVFYASRPGEEPENGEEPPPPPIEP